MPQNVRTMPRWLVPCLWALGILVLYVFAPWLLSLIGVRHGWTGGLPGPWNLIGLVITGGGVRRVVLVRFDALLALPEPGPDGVVATVSSPAGSVSVLA